MQLPDFETLRDSRPARRAFIARMAAAGLGVAATQLFAAPGKVSSRSGPITVPDLHRITPSNFTGIPGRNINEQVLNFALTLEELEADLYRQALNYASGRKLRLRLDSNPAVYGRRVDAGDLTSAEANIGFVYLRDFAYVEAAHRDFLITAIRAGGGRAVHARFTGYKFPTMPEAKMDEILKALLPLEETGVRAYLGAIRSFTDLALAQTAATIFSTECRHSAAIRYILGMGTGPSEQPGDLKDPVGRAADNTFEYYLEPQTVIAAAQSFNA